MMSTAPPNSILRSRHGDLGAEVDHEAVGQPVARAHGRLEGREPHVRVVRRAGLRVQDLGYRARVPAAAEDVQVRGHRGHLAEGKGLGCHDDL